MTEEQKQDIFNIIREESDRIKYGQVMITVLVKDRRLISITAETKRTKNLCSTN